MENEQFGIIHEFFGESLEIQRENRLSWSNLSDEISIISLNLEDAVKMYREKLEEEKKLTESLPQMGNVSSPTSFDNLTTVSFYMEQNAITMDKVFGVSGHLLMETLFSIDRGIQHLVQTRKQTTAERQNGGGGQQTQLGSDIKTLDTISNSINLFVSSINTSVNRRYVKNIATFNKSIGVLMSGIRDAISKVDKTSMETFSKASMFIVDYSSGIASIDTRKITDSKLRAIRRSISIFEMSELRGVSINRTKTVAESMSLFSTHLVPFMEAISRARIPSERRMRNMMRSIGDFVKSFADVMRVGDASKMKAVGDMLGSIGSGIRKFAWRIMIASPLLVLAMPGMAIFKLTVKFLKNELSFIASNADGLQKGAKGIALMGLSVLAFAGSLALTTLIMRQIDVRQLIWGLAITSVAMYGMSRLFMYFGSGRQAMRITAGAKAIAFMSASLVLSALSLMAVSQVAVNFANVGILVLSLGALSIVYNFIGKSWMHISKGALAISLIALSTYLFSASIAFSASVAEKHWKGALIFMGLSAGIATIWGVAGMFFPYIALGAGAMVLVGLSLIAFAYPLEMIGDAMQKSGDALVKHLPQFIKNMILPMTLMGAVSPIIILGSLALGAVGTALIPFSRVLSSLSSVNVDKSKMEDISASIVSLTKGASTALSELSFFDGLRIGVLESVGRAISIFADSMMKFSSIGDISKIASTSASVGEMFRNIMHSVIIATSPDAIKKMYDIDTDWIRIQGSIMSASHMSSTMMDLADGVMKWKDMKLEDGDGERIANNIKSIIGIIPASIAPMGRFFDDDDDMWNLWGILRKSDKDVEEKRKFEYLNGQTFSLREVRNGLRFTAKLGDALGDLADGVKKWAEMKLSSDEVSLIEQNIKTILGVIPQKIADFGGLDSDEVINAGFLGMFQKSSVERGLEYTEDLGTSLLSLANGVQKWKDAKLSSEDVDLIKSNIEKIMGVLPGLVAQFGEKDKDVIPTGFMGLILKTTVQRGIDYTKGIGESLIPLYDGVVKWKGISISDSDRKTIQKNIEGILTTIPQVFMALADEADKGTGIFGLADSDLQKGVDAVQVFNEPLNKLVETIKNYTSIKDADISTMQMGAVIRRYLQMVNEGFSFLNTSKVDAFQRFIKPFSEFTKLIVQFGKDMKDLSADWKQIESVIDKASSYETNRVRSSYSFDTPKSSFSAFPTNPTQSPLQVQKSNKDLLKVEKKAGESGEQLRNRQMEQILMSLGMILDALGYKNNGGVAQESAVASLLSDIRDVMQDGNMRVRLSSN